MKNLAPGASVAYRGYLIRRNLTGGTWVEKDGQHICWASSEADAKSKIDQLQG